MYDIRIEHLNLMQMIEDAEGEMTPEVEQALVLTQDQFNEKALSYGLVVKHFEDEESVIAREMERLSEKLSQAKKRKELFKQKLSDAMQQFGVEKIETPTLKLSFRKSQSTEVDDGFADRILKYFKVSFELDKQKIDDQRSKLDAAAKENPETVDNDEVWIIAMLADLQNCFNIKPSFVKTPITELLKQGVKVPGASIVAKKNLQIK